MPLFSVLGIGAIYEDIILTVPEFPHEDSKLRATSRISRLGGNVPNTLGVLSQILAERNPDSDPALFFVGALGDDKSSSFLKHELEIRHIRPFIVNRTDNNNPPTAYILESAAAKTRTIISYNEVLDLSLDELLNLIQNSKLSILGGRAETRPNPSWIHFEGRNCNVLHKALSTVHIKLSRDDGNSGLYTKWDGMISVDFERPGREGLRELLGLVDVAFISKSYAISIATQEDGYNPSGNNPHLVWYFSNKIGKEINKKAICYITLGSDGCSLLFHEETRKRYSEIVHPQYSNGDWHFNFIEASGFPSESVTETTGAGDTFIAAVIFGLGALKLDPFKAGKLGNVVAGRKCLQKGFEGVWKDINLHNPT